MNRREAVKTVLGGVVALGIPATAANVQTLPKQPRVLAEIYRREVCLKRTGENEFTEMVTWQRTRMCNLREGDFFAMTWGVDNPGFLFAWASTHGRTQGSNEELPGEGIITALPYNAEEADTEHLPVKDHLTKLARIHTGVTPEYTYAMFKEREA